MKRIIIAISVVASVALFGFIFFLVENTGSSKSAVTGTAGVSDQSPVMTASTNTVAPNVTKVTLPSATETNAAKTVTPQPTRTTKTS